MANGIWVGTLLPSKKAGGGTYDWTLPITGGPTSHGFDHYFGDGTINFPPYAWLENDRFTAVPSEPLPIKDLEESLRFEGRLELRSGPAVPGWDIVQVFPTLHARSLDLLRRQAAGDQPFFTYIAYPSPHTPIIPNDPFIDQSQAGLYGDFVVQTDHAVGEVLQVLEETGIADNTLVILTSDNGAEHYRGKRAKKFQHNSSGALRGGKRDMFEGGHRVPFIVRWPAAYQGQQVSQHLTSQIDIFATVAGIIGAPVPEGAAEDSLDLSLAWSDLNQPPIRTEHVHNTWEGAYALRQGDWVLIDYPNGEGKKGRGKGKGNAAAGFLFDLVNDLGQQQNRYADDPDRVAALQDRLAEIVGAEKVNNPAR